MVMVVASLRVAKGMLLTLEYNNKAAEGVIATVDAPGKEDGST